MPTSSELPSIEYPFDTPLWSFFFDSEYSVLHDRPVAEVRGFREGDTGQLISYSQLRDLSTSASVALKREHRLSAGQTVCIFGTNSIWYTVALFSALRLGAIVSGASPASKVDEMIHCLKISNAKVIFTVKDSLPTALAAAKAAGIPEKHVILFQGTAPGIKTLTELIDHGTLWQTVSLIPPYEFPAGKDAANVCAFLSFSSGTTGLPKAVQISHANMIAQCYQVKQISRPQQLSNVCLAVLPFFHIAGLSQLTFVPIFLNQEAVVLSKFDMQFMLEAVTKYKVYEMWVVPPILIRLVNDPIVQKYDLSGVKHLQVGAAPVSSEVIAAVKKRFPHFIIRNNWGMTELTGIGATTAPEYQGFDYAHTVGKALGSMSIKVVDPISGNELGPNEPGEILLKGPNVTMGYLNNEKATRETYEPDGYIHTGDLGSIDEEGFLIIQDRIKELIKVKGTAVAPAEIEDLLFGHALVEDVAVIGIPDTYAGEIPKAFIVLKGYTEQSEATKKVLVEFVKEKASRYKWLEGGVEFVDEIPKSNSGKILRRILKEAHLAEVRKMASKL